MLRTLEQRGVYTKGGYLDSEKLYEALKQGIVDQEVLINSI